MESEEPLPGEIPEESAENALPPKRPKWKPWDPNSGEPPRRPRGRPPLPPELKKPPAEKKKYVPVAAKKRPPGSLSKQKPKYNQVDKIIARFQMTVYEIAEALDVVPSTVYRWRHPRAKGGNDGLIPNYYLTRLLKYARYQGVVIRPRDLEPERIVYPGPQTPDPFPEISDDEP